MPKRQRDIPPPVVRRLTKYLDIAKQLDADGKAWISSQELATRLGLTSSTVRQDLTHVSVSGVSNRGYDMQAFQGGVAKVLGVDRSWSLIVMGAGNLGCALALYRGFRQRGYLVRGIFDQDPLKVGKWVGDLTVQPIGELAYFMRHNHIDLGVIAVTPEAAQQVSDELVKAGVCGLLNLASAHITAPEHVTVVEANFIAGLQELTHGIMRHS